MLVIRNGKKAHCPGCGRETHWDDSCPWATVEATCSPCDGAAEIEGERLWAKAALDAARRYYGRGRY